MRMMLKYETEAYADENLSQFSYGRQDYMQ